MDSPTGKTSKEALASNTSLRFTSTLTIEFIEVPKEKQEAFIASLRYFSKKISEYQLEETLTAPKLEPETVRSMEAVACSIVQE